MQKTDAGPNRLRRASSGRQVPQVRRRTIRLLKRLRRIGTADWARARCRRGRAVVIDCCTGFAISGSASPPRRPGFEAFDFAQLRTWYVGFECCGQSRASCEGNAVAAAQAQPHSKKTRRRCRSRSQNSAQPHRILHDNYKKRDSHRSPHSGTASDLNGNRSTWHTTSRQCANAKVGDTVPTR